MVMNVSNAATDTAALGRGVPGSNVSAASSLPKRQAVAADGQDQDRASRTEPDQVAETTVKAAVMQINDYLQSVQRNLEFSIDESTGCTVVTVRDAATDEVIRQIPPETTLAIMRAFASQEEGGQRGGLLLREQV